MKSAKYYGGKARRTTSKGAQLTLGGLRAKALYVLVTKCPSCGSVDVRWNDRSVKRLSLKGASASRVLVPVTSFSTVRTGRLRIVVTSTNRPVVIEGAAGYRDDVR